MCYLVAKDVNKTGSIAIQTEHGKHLSEFKSSLLKKIGYDRIQLITISRSSAYVEYEPDRFVTSEEEFAEIVEAM